MRSRRLIELPQDVLHVQSAETEQKAHQRRVAAPDAQELGVHMSPTKTDPCQVVGEDRDDHVALHSKVAPSRELLGDEVDGGFARHERRDLDAVDRRETLEALDAQLALAPFVGAQRRRFELSGGCGLDLVEGQVPRVTQFAETLAELSGDDLGKRRVTR